MGEQDIEIVKDGAGENKKERDQRQTVKQLRQGEKH